MTERGTKTMIGAFVLGGIALLIAGIILIGTGTLFSKNANFVLFFNASLRGLVPGAPVYFKGVRVGQVNSIQINTDADDLTFSTPVIIMLESALISGEMPGDPDEEYDVMNDERAVQSLIRQGLRARLGTQSFVTGQLSVDLDILPDADFVDPSTLKRFRGLQQIPTVPSSLDAMFDVFRRIPFEEIAGDIHDAAQEINRQVSGMDLPALTGSLTTLSDELRKEVAHWGEVRQRAAVAVGNIADLAEDLNTRLPGTVRRADTALANLATLLDTSGKTMESATALLKEDSAPMLELSQTMQALRDASAALTRLATLLELKPESLIFGRTR